MLSPTLMPALVGTIGGLRKTIQEAFQIQNCRLLGLDTDDVPLASMPNLNAYQAITVVPQQENKRLAVARVINYADTREAPLPGGSGPAPSVGSGNTPTYSDLLRRIVQLTNLVFLNDGDQTRTEMLELQEKYERLSAQNWQLRQQLMQASNGAQGNPLAPTPATAINVQVAHTQAEVETLRAEIAELQEIHRLRVTDLEMRLEAALNKISQLEASGAGGNAQSQGSGISGTVEEGRLYEEIRDIKIASGSGTTVQGGSTPGAGGPVGGGPGESDANLGWLTAQDRAQLLADAAAAARAQTIVECAQIVAATMQISFEQARALLCGEVADAGTGTGASGNAGMAVSSSSLSSGDASRGDLLPEPSLGDDVSTRPRHLSALQE